MEPEFIDELMGTHLPTEIILEKLLPTEVRLIEKLVRDFHLTPTLRTETIRVLYRFKMLFRHYSVLWHKTKDELTEVQAKDARDIFEQIQINLDRDSRRCWSHNTFFKPVRLMLYACQKLDLPTARKEIYLRWLYNFPVIPEKSIKDVFEHELQPANQPHKYMYMVSGLIRKGLGLSFPRTRITREYYDFLRERNIPRAHNRWFGGRFSGSYGSRQ